MMASLAVFAPSRLFRAGLAALVGTMGFAPVEEAADLNELMRREGDPLRPELVLISPPSDQAELAGQVQEIKAWAPDARVVFIAPVLDTPALSACFAAGASGYVIESISREGLKHSLRLVSAGENVFPSDLAGALTALSGEGREPLDVLSELHDLHASDREIEILRHLANGESNSAIARTLNISDAEVSADIRQILRRLRLSNRMQAALWAVSRGLAAPFSGVAGSGRGRVSEVKLN